MLGATVSHTRGGAARLRTLRVEAIEVREEALHPLDVDFVVTAFRRCQQHAAGSRTSTDGAAATYDHRLPTSFSMYWPVFSRTAGRTALLR